MKLGGHHYKYQGAQAHLYNLGRSKKKIIYNLGCHKKMQQHNTPR
jgi:hypothetical protein